MAVVQLYGQRRGGAAGLWNTASAGVDRARDQPGDDSAFLRADQYGVRVLSAALPVDELDLRRDPGGHAAAHAAVERAGRSRAGRLAGGSSDRTAGGGD